MKRIALLCLALPSLFTACADADVDGDAIDDSFLSGGKADTFGLFEGSPEARGVLAVANTLAKPALVEDVGLVTRAANAILAHRAGADGEAGTADDDRLDDLAELDAVPWIGEISFGHLLAYAEANGYVDVDPFAEASCSGPAITLDRLQALTDGGTRALPNGRTWIRSRTCDGALGCGPWGEPQELVEPGESTLTYTTATGLAFRAAYDRTESVLLPQGYLDRITRYEWRFTMTDAATPEIEPGIAHHYYWFGDNVSSYDDLEDVALTFTGDCMRASGHLSDADTEREVVFLATFGS
jgi:hypothetical protein